jgi:hypothetical protein
MKTKAKKNVGLKAQEVSRKPLSKKVYIYALLIPIAYFFMSLYLVKDYGITVDEPACFDFGHKYWQFYKTGYLDIYGSTPADANHPDFSVNWEEGVVWPFVNTLSAATCDIFYKYLKILSPIDAHHMVDPVVASVFFYILFIFLSENFGIYVGLLTCLAVITYPYFFGFALNDTKDIPKLAFFAAILFSFYKWSETKQLKYFYIAFILWGFFNATRMEAAILPFILFIWMIPDIFRSIKDRSLFKPLNIVHLAAAGSLALIIYILCWPPLIPWAYDSLRDWWEDGTKFGLWIINFMKYVGSQPNPEYTWNIYALRQIYYFTPVPMLILFAIGLIPVLKESFKNKLLALLMVWLIFILGRHSFPHIAHYCGMHHFFDFMIPFMVVAAFGSRILARFLSKFLSLGPTFSKVCVGALLIVPNIKAIVDYHPYEVLYYNELAGGLKGAVEKQVPWCFDYLLTSYRETADWINKNAVKDAYYFAIYDSVIFRHYITRKDLKGIFRRPGSMDFPPNTYLIENMPHRVGGREDNSPYELVYRIKRGTGGGIVSSIYFLSGNTMQAFKSLQQAITLANKGDMDGALVNINDAIEKNPKLGQAHLIRGVIYLRKGLVDKARESFNKVLEINPDDQDARQYLYQISRNAGR